MCGCGLQTTPQTVCTCSPFPMAEWPCLPCPVASCPHTIPHFPTPHTLPVPHNSPISTQQTAALWAGPPSILHTEFPHSQWQNGPAQPALWPAAPHNSPIAQSHTIPPPQGPGGWAVYRKPHSVGWLVSTQAVHVHIVELCVAPQLAVHVHTVVMVW